MVMGYGQHEKPEEPKLAKDYVPEELAPAIQPGPYPVEGLEEPQEKEPVVVSKFGIPWKAIIGFFTVFFGQLLARVTVNDIPVLPENLNGWISLVGGSAFAAFVIYFKANVMTVPQAQKNLEIAKNKAK